MTHHGSGDAETPRPSEAELRQFKVVRERGGVNMLNRTQVARIARKEGLSALADAADRKARYYALLDRYVTEARAFETTAGGEAAEATPE